MLQESESNKSKHCKRHPFPILPHLSSRLGGLGFSLSVLGWLVRFAFFVIGCSSQEVSQPISIVSPFAIRRF